MFGPLNTFSLQNFNDHSIQPCKLLPAPKVSSEPNETGGHGAPPRWLWILQGEGLAVLCCPPGIHQKCQIHVRQPNIKTLYVFPRTKRKLFVFTLSSDGSKLAPYLRAVAEELIRASDLLVMDIIKLCAQVDGDIFLRVGFGDWRHHQRVWRGQRQSGQRHQ